MSIFKVLRAARARGLSPVRNVAPKLTCLEPRVLPISLERRVRFVRWVNRVLVGRSIRRWVHRLGLRDGVVLFYSPLFVSEIGRLKELAAVYHCVDHYPSFPVHRRDRDRVERLDRTMTQRTDLVLASSPALVERLSSVRGDVAYLPNVADYDLFSLGSSRQMRSTCCNPRLYFHGALEGHKVDVELLLELARRRPEWSLTLVGPSADLGSSCDAFKKLVELANVDWLGRRPQEELPGLIIDANVLLLPYRLSEHTRHILPLKLFEYMATGKPIVSTRLEAVAEYGDLLELADGVDEFESAIDRCLLEEEGDFAPARQHLARQHTWDKRVEEIRIILRDRLSIVL